MRVFAAILLVVTLLGCAPKQHVAAPEAGAPPAGAGRYVRPRQAVPSCIQNRLSAFKIPDGVRLPERATMRFAVHPDGRVSDVSSTTPVPAQFSDAVRDAVEGCTWVPGTDAKGKPIGMWVLLPFKFVNNTVQTDATPATGGGE